MNLVDIGSAVHYPRSAKLFDTAGAFTVDGTDQLRVTGYNTAARLAGVPESVKDQPKQLTSISRNNVNHQPE